MIGYYVHHHGAGHLARAQAIIAHLDTPVTVLSSLPRPSDWPGEWVVLAPDDRAVHPVDVTARGSLHWVPRHDHGVRTRARQITSWIDAARPALLVVDVSVEVTMLARLTGTPVVVVAMPGVRDDRPHRTAYDCAEALLAPWPRDFDLGPTQAEWAAKTWQVGAFSRFDGRPRIPSPRPGTLGVRRPRALLLWGSGGSEATAPMLAEVRSATPGWSWSLAGPGRQRGPQALWRELCLADVVVTHAGQNAVAEVAAAGTPAVVVASPRPFEEQVHTSRALSRHGVAVGLDSWPEPTRWPELLDRARCMGADRWKSWSYGDGACRSAAQLDRLAASLSAGSGSSLSRTAV